MRFITTWRIWVASAITLGSAGERSYLMTTFLLTDTLRRWPISRTTSLSEMGLHHEAPLPE